MPNFFLFIKCPPFCLSSKKDTRFIFIFFKTWPYFNEGIQQFLDNSICSAWCSVQLRTLKRRWAKSQPAPRMMPGRRWSSSLCPEGGSKLWPHVCRSLWNSKFFQEASLKLKNTFQKSEIAKHSDIYLNFFKHQGSPQGCNQTITLFKIK